MDHRPTTASNSADVLQFVQSSSLSTLLRAEIEQRILRGEFPHGERINESELATQFRISRGPIREALRALAEGGLVRSEKNRGVFVRTITPAEAEDIYEVRESLEALIGRRVAARLTEPQLAALRTLLAAMDQATTAGNVAHYHALNLEFHETLANFAGNARLSDTYRRLTKELILFRLQGLRDGGGFAVSRAEHGAIVDAIASRDPERAGEALRAHTVASRGRMRLALARLAAGNRDASDASDA